MSAARRLEAALSAECDEPGAQGGSPRPGRARRSTLDPEADMLAAALLERGRGGMSVQTEFADGDVVPGTRYRVIGLIGSGGMGSVYEVEHEELGKRFVLKALLSSLTNRDDLVHRLRNEWRALGRLEHPNIVSVTDAGLTATGVPFYVMERLQGETLSARLRRERRLPLPDALGIAAEVLEGLSAAHRIGIIHRDIKPPNIFLVGSRAAKLLDFGIAKLLDPKASQITGRGIAIGTPRYMAPEQATGGAVDARTDVYATGLILFEMLAGSGPFDGARDANELFLAHLAKDAPPVSATAPGIPAELDRCLERLLAKKPEHRPADAAQVAAELRALRERVSGPHRAAPAPIGPDDRTNPGGPFDTLEAAHTVPSDGPEESRARRPLNDATTRTGIGPRGDTEAQSGQTLRLDALDVRATGGTHDGRDRTEAPTRTAAPFPQLETPPPVEPAQAPPEPARSGAGRRRSPAGAVLAVALVAAVAAAVVFRAPPAPVTTTGASAGQAPAAALEPAPVTPSPVEPALPALPFLAEPAPTPISAPTLPSASPKTVVVSPVSAPSARVGPPAPAPRPAGPAPSRPSAARTPLVGPAPPVSTSADRVSAPRAAPVPKARTNSAGTAPLPGSGL